MRPVSVFAKGPGSETDQLRGDLHGRWRQATRAVMVLLSLQGLAPAQIAALLDCHPATVLRWIGRFNSEGAGRAGRPAPVRAASAGRAPADRADHRAARAPAAFGERVTLWCQAGITHGDLEAARDVLRAACWASDIHVLASARYAHLVVLEVVRRLPDEPPDEVVPGWPYRNRGGVEEDGADPGEPALYGGPGHHRPFG